MSAKSGLFATKSVDELILASQIDHGLKRSLTALDLMMLGIGLTVAILLARAARGLQAPPGSGYT